MASNDACETEDEDHRGSGAEDEAAGSQNGLTSNDGGRQGRAKKHYVPKSDRTFDPSAPAEQNILTLRDRWWPEGKYLLKDFMSDFDLTQRELADKVGQVDQSVYKFSRPNRVADIKWLLFLCEVAQVPLAAIVTKQWKPVPLVASASHEVQIGSALLGLLLSAVERTPSREMSFGPETVRKVTLRAPENAQAQLEIELADGRITVPVGG